MSFLKDLSTSKSPLAPWPGRVQGRVAAISSKGARVDIEVAGEFVDDFSLAPFELFLPRASSSGPIRSAMIYCRTRDGEPFSIRSAEAGPNFEVRIKDEAEQLSIRRIEVELKKAAISKASREQKLTIEAESKKGIQKLVVPIMIHPALAEGPLE